MNAEPRSSGGKTGMWPTKGPTLDCLPVHFRRESAEATGIDLRRGTMRSKQPRAYYLDGLTAIFQPGVPLPRPLDMEEKFVRAEVAMLNAGPSGAEVLGLINRFPEIKSLHLIESCEANLDVIRSELQKEVKHRELPELSGYVTDLRNLPAELAGRCDLVVEINGVDPKADKLFRQDAVQQISRLLKLGGLFYSAGVTVRWTERVVPLSLVRIRLRGKNLKHAGYSDALPRPVVYLKHSPDVTKPRREEAWWRGRWRKGFELIGRGKDTASERGVESAAVPRVEDGRGEPNPAPWHFLITKPAIRRPAMNWEPKEGEGFGKLTLSMLLQRNRQTGMWVFRVRECPEVVLKIMKPFEGDIPDDPLEWDNLRKSKTLKRENQALKLLKGLPFIPQRIAHGYDPATGWYAIVVEHADYPSLSDFIIAQHNQRHRRDETPADVNTALEMVRQILNSLAIVHDKGLVHQDLKPAHVLLRPDSSEAVLIDWGLARQINEPLSEERRSISWLHAAPERADINVVTTAGIHQDLYAVGVMLLQLASELDLKEQPRMLFEYFSKHGRMPAAAELKVKLREHWHWAAPIIARAISSRKDVSGYADHRFANAREMSAEIVRHFQGSCAVASPPG